MSDVISPPRFSVVSVALLDVIMMLKKRQGPVGS